jgi:hypothetical protein
LWASALLKELLLLVADDPDDLGRLRIIAGRVWRLACLMLAGILLIVLQW